MDVLKENDCSKCPYYHWEKDYWGECDEYCLISCDLFKPCKKPMLVRKLINLKLSIIDCFYEWKMEIDGKRELNDWEE